MLEGFVHWLGVQFLQGHAEFLIEFPCLNHSVDFAGMAECTMD